MPSRSTAVMSPRLRPRRYANLLALAVAGLCLAALPGSAQDTKTPPPDVPKNSGAPVGYRIGAGDVLQINVWRENEVSVQGIVVRPDGKVTLPLVKEVDVMGQTPAELEKNLAAKLAQFINGADVTVVVREIHSKKVYMVGAVNRVGPIPLLSDLTVLQALAEAGGSTTTPSARRFMSCAPRAASRPNTFSTTMPC